MLAALLLARFDRRGPEVGRVRLQHQGTTVGVDEGERFPPLIFLPLSSPCGDFSSS